MSVLVLPSTVEYTLLLLTILFFIFSMLVTHDDIVFFLKTVSPVVQWEHMIYLPDVCAFCIRRHLIFVVINYDCVFYDQLKLCTGLLDLDSSARTSASFGMCSLQFTV